MIGTWVILCLLELHHEIRVAILSTGSTIDLLLLLFWRLHSLIFRFIRNITVSARKLRWLLLLGIHFIFARTIANIIAICFFIILHFSFLYHSSCIIFPDCITVFIFFLFFCLVKLRMIRSVSVISILNESSTFVLKNLITRILFGRLLWIFHFTWLLGHLRARLLLSLRRMLLWLNCHSLFLLRLDLWALRLLLFFLFLFSFDSFFLHEILSVYLNLRLRLFN